MKRLALCSMMMLVCAAAFAQEADFVYDSHGRHDPFLPLVSLGGAMVNYEPAAMVSSLLLEGIIADENGAVAIINGNVVEPGTMIDGYKVLSVTSDQVILEKDGQEIVLTLKKEE
jgi:hypothetical protein